ncbi:putative lipoprotein YiaD precursor [compost metagenome]
MLDNQQRIVQLQMERQRLRDMLRDARLLSAQQPGRWGDDQIISMAATETDRGLVMTLGDVLFRADSDELGREANRTLLKLAHFLELNPQRRVRIEGYTDSRGDADRNLALSKARAEAVAEVLTDLGIASQRIEIRGYGEAFPVAENASARGRAQNRRVEILFSDAQGELGPDR